MENLDLHRIVYINKHLCTTYAHIFMKPRIVEKITHKLQKFSYALSQMMLNRQKIEFMNEFKMNLVFFLPQLCNNSIILIFVLYRAGGERELMSWAGQHSRSFVSSAVKSIFFSVWSPRYSKETNKVFSTDIIENIKSKICWNRFGANRKLYYLVAVNEKLNWNETQRNVKKRITRK